MSLFAHHLEVQHLPVLAVFLGVGIWTGWQVVTLLLKQRGRANSD